MILILSADWDTHVDFVISWLKESSQSYIRVNVEELITEKVYVDLKEGVICIGEKRLDKRSINAVWFRKFGFNVSKKKIDKELRSKIESDVLNSIFTEYTTLINAIRFIFSDAYWITKPWNASVNKINILQKAFNFGLNIPNTWIVSSKDQLKKIVENNDQRVIFKSIADSHALFSVDGYYSMFTKELTLDMINKLPQQFMPSLIQSMIPKKYEVRSFYLEGKFYSMCIFSQDSRETEVDFRKAYISREKIRTIPYKINDDDEEKLTRLLNDVDINCCSIDMIKSSFDNKLYFLEINPTGAFGMVNTPCNYELYKLIAQTLTSKDNEKILY